MSKRSASLAILVSASSRTVMASHHDDINDPAHGFQEVSRIAADYLEKEEALPPRAIAADELANSLGVAIGSKGLPIETVLVKLEAVLRATPSAASRRFLNQLFGGRDLAATLAEMLVPLTNTSMYTFKVAGAQVLIEREVLSRMLAAVPFPDGQGAFLPGGSLANLTAMLIARNQTLDDVREQGLDDQRVAVYTSADAHYSIRKAAGILGLGRRCVREIAVDEKGALIPEELERSIQRDRSLNVTPIFVNATAGTTVLGAVDPLPELAAVCQRHGVWLHVDAALGGSVLLSESYRHLLDGASESDSFTWNAHKMMGVPLPCSVLLLRTAGLLEAHLGEQAGYLFQADEAELNPGTRSLQCGRRNDALKLWAAWQVLGDEGYDRRLTALLDLARTTARLVEEDPELELVVSAQTVNVCLRVPGVSSAAICDHLDRHDILKIGHGMAQGHSAIRIVCVDPRLDEGRIHWVLDEIKRAARVCGSLETGR